MIICVIFYLNLSFMALSENICKQILRKKIPPGLHVTVHWSPAYTATSSRKKPATKNVNEPLFHT